MTYFLRWNISILVKNGLTVGKKSPVCHLINFYLLFYFFWGHILHSQTLTLLPAFHFIFSDFLEVDEDDLTRRQPNMEEPPLGCFVLFVISGEFLLSMPPFPTFTTSSIFTNLFASVLKSFHHTWSFFSQKLIKYLMKNTKEFSHKVKFCIKPVSHKEYLPHFGNFRPLKRYKGLGD